MRDGDWESGIEGDESGCVSAFVLFVSVLPSVTVLSPVVPQNSCFSKKVQCQWRIGELSVASAHSGSGRSATRTTIGRLATLAGWSRREPFMECAGTYSRHGNGELLGGM